MHTTRIDTSGKTSHSETVTVYACGTGLGELWGSAREIYDDDTTSSGANLHTITVTDFMKPEAPTDLAFSLFKPPDRDFQTFMLTYTRQSESGVFQRFEFQSADREGGSYTSLTATTAAQQSERSGHQRILDSDTEERFWVVEENHYDTWFKVRGRACKSIDIFPSQRCGDWGDFSNEIYVATVFDLTPDERLALGGTSEVWEVPAGPGNIYVKVELDSRSIQYINTGPGVINIKWYPTGDETEDEETHFVQEEDETDGGSGVLYGESIIREPAEGGSKVWIEAEKDAFATQSPIVRLTFYSGGDTTGDIIAMGSVQLEAKPATPDSGSATVSASADTVNLMWSSGSGRGTPNPDHYRIEIANTSWGSGTVDDTGQISSELTIQNSRSQLGVGNHTAEVRHCNAAGGCSDSLSIFFTVPTAPVQPLSPPTNLSMSIESGDDNDLDVNFTRSESPHNYRFELSRADSQSGMYTVVENAYASTSPADFDDQSKGYWYRARGTNCRTYSPTPTPTWTGCGGWSGSSSPINLKLLPPTNLSMSIESGDDNDLDVNFTRSESPHHYQFELSRADSQSGTQVYDREYASTSPADFDDQSKGYWYKARGRNCRTYTATPTPTWTGCGDWSGYSTAIYLKLSPPTNLTLEVDATDNQKLILQYDRGPEGAFFQFILKKSSTEIGMYADAATIPALSSPAAHTGSDIGYWYKVRGRNCRSYTETPTPTWTECSDWSPYSSAYALRLFTPMGLDVIPMPKLRAKLTWEPVNQASAYEVGLVDAMGVFNAGGAWHDDPSRSHDGRSATNEITIKLDEILLTNDSYDFQVRAIYATGTSPPVPNPTGDSLPSPVVTLIDSPLLAEGGYADGTSPPGTGKVALSWTSIRSVDHYEIRYRELGDRKANFGQIQPVWVYIDHSDVAWPYSKDSPYYEAFKDLDPDPSGGSTSAIIRSAAPQEIYAIQVNYETITGASVFSARDAYAYSGDGYPPISSDSDRVGTYPMFGHWETKNYVYSICDETFRGPHKDIWIDLIKHAFEQWEFSTGLVEMTPSDETTSPTPCKVYVDAPFSMITSHKNDVNEVFMVHEDSLSEGLEYGHYLLENYLFTCVYEAPACVISQAYYDTEDPERDLAHYAVDVLISKTRLDRINTLTPGSTVQNIPGTDRTPHRNDVLFHHCTTLAGKVGDYYPYETLVHEAGHALGISGFRRLALTSKRQSYEMSHPTVYDSVMNYDNELWANRDSNGVVIRDEPDCSPHPFDIMAIFALYQTIP